jgi:hypothetical protein
MLIIEQGSYGYGVGIDCYKEDDVTPVDLSVYGAVYLKVWVPGVPGTILLTGTCSVSGTSHNVANYLLKLHDFDVVGTFSGNIQGVNAGTVVYKSKMFYIKVEEAA